MRVEGFSSSIDVLYRGLFSNFFYQKNRRNFSCIFFLNPYPDPDSLEMMDPDPIHNTAFQREKPFTGTVWYQALVAHLLVFKSEHLRHLIA
jgi:hypothetical protein